ncbi:MAG TPA: DUF2474 domain-containing protein [Steroidobacteraceae bacterium]|nr:DUF2474 domain-containing protein [Steroidobacteraceae bacterium]
MCLDPGGCRNAQANCVTTRLCRVALDHRRIDWLLLLWTTSAAALALVAALFRILMNATGLTSG